MNTLLSVMISSFIVIATLIVSTIFGLTPYLLYKYDLFNLDLQKEVESLSYVGGMFGPASTIFSGLALISVIFSIRQQGKEIKLQKKELELNRAELKNSADAQKEIAELQKKAISLEIVMPFMNEITSPEVGQATKTLRKFKDRNQNFDSIYANWIQSYNSDTISEEELSSYTEIDNARRKFVGIFHKMQRLSQANVVDEPVIKAVIGPDHCWILLNIVEPLDAKIRVNYSKNSFNFARGLYSSEVIEEHGTYKQKSP